MAKAIFKSGEFSAILAYLCWGFLPIYWKALSHVPAKIILAHRICWVTLSLAIILGIFGRFGDLKKIFLNRKLFLFACAGALLISVNWLTYIWAVNQGRVIETSLGYYLNPLLSVVLGVLLLGEKLRPLQFLSVLIAGLALAYNIGALRQLPWVALVLALTFGFYGLLKKRAHLPNVATLFFETAVMSPLAFGYLLNQRKNLDFSASLPYLDFVDIQTSLLLVGTGIATAVPMLLFSRAAKKVGMIPLGFMQFIGPTVQLICAVLIFKEEFGLTKQITFSLVGFSLLIYVFDLALAKNQRRKNRANPNIEAA